MKIRRIAPIAALGLAALALTGCTKPSPTVSVVSGTHSVNEEALCWDFNVDESGLDCQNLATNLQDAMPSALAVPSMIGNTVGISVDPVVAEEGWTAFFNGQPLSQTPITETYYRFTIPAGTTLDAEGTPLAVASISDNKMRGLWLFKITN